MSSRELGIEIRESGLARAIGAERCASSPLPSWERGRGRGGARSPQGFSPSPQPLSHQGRGARYRLFFSYPRSGVAARNAFSPDRFPSPPLPLWEAEQSACRLPVAADALWSPSEAKVGWGRGGECSRRASFLSPQPLPQWRRGETHFVGWAKRSAAQRRDIERHREIQGCVRWATLRLAQPTWQSFVRIPPHRSRCGGCEARDALRPGARSRVPSYRAQGRARAASSIVSGR